MRIFRLRCVVFIFSCTAAQLLAVETRSLDGLWDFAFEEYRVMLLDWMRQYPRKCVVNGIRHTLANV